MRPVGFGNLFIYYFIFFIHDIVYPFTTRGWKILDYSRRVTGNKSRIIENFQSSTCILLLLLLLLLTANRLDAQLEALPKRK
jgi:hypothetical protein